MVINNVSQLPVKSHLFLKGNDVASRYASKVTAQSLAFIYKSLKDQNIPVKEAANAVDRYK